MCCIVKRDNIYFFSKLAFKRRLLCSCLLYSRNGLGFKYNIKNVIPDHVRIITLLKLYRVVRRNQELSTIWKNSRTHGCFIK